MKVHMELVTGKDNDIVLADFEDWDAANEWLKENQPELLKPERFHHKAPGFVQHGMNYHWVTLTEDKEATA